MTTTAEPALAGLELDPGRTGFDASRLERITEHIMGRYIEPGKLAGAQVAVARHGALAYLRSFGVLEVGTDRPVTADTIWRIYSMTKPITSLALMTLYERSLFKLSDPVHRFIPEWRDQKVAVSRPGGGMDLVEPERPVQIRDLLTHTSGLSYGWEVDHPVDRLYRQARVLADDVELATMAQRLGELPLKFQPGSRWHYSLATDVCGRLVEVISGQRFDDYLESTIFKPLGMVDTGFTVPDESIGRFASSHTRRRDRSLRVVEDAATSSYRKPKALLSGGGGLVSTMADYLRFCELIRCGGEHEGHRVIGSETLRFMGRNHLPGGASLAEVALGTFGEVGFDGVGFGLGFAVTIDPVAAGVVGSPGDLSWGGAASTIFWVDPAQDLEVVFMTQLFPSGTFDFRSQLKQLVYQALD